MDFVEGEQRGSGLCRGGSKEGVDFVEGGAKREWTL